MIASSGTAGLQATRSGEANTMQQDKLSTLLEKLDHAISKRAARLHCPKKKPHTIIIGNTERILLGAATQYRGYTLIHSPLHESLIKVTKAHNEIPKSTNLTTTLHDWHSYNKISKEDK